MQVENIPIFLSLSLVFPLFPITANIFGYLETKLCVSRKPIYYIFTRPRPLLLKTLGGVVFPILCLPQKLTTSMLTFCKSTLDSVASLPSGSIFVLQLFDHVGEAEMTIRNIGKMGFRFSIIHPDREDEDEADDEAGRQRKTLKEHTDAKMQENYEGQEVRPGQPIFIPTTVSSCSCYFRNVRSIYYACIYVGG